MDSSAREKYLRETTAHQDILFLFLKTVVLSDVFKRNATRNDLSRYVHFSLEAYIILTYVNGYEGWKEQMDVASSSSEASQQSVVSELTSASRRLYTNNARGKGKYKGWSAEGVKLFHEVADILEQQRKAESCSNFDAELKTRFFNQVNDGGGGSAAAGADQGVPDRSWITAHTDFTSV